MDHFNGNTPAEELYADIIGLPHHVSKTYPPMPLLNRAAQFAPFAALTGYDAAIEETARLTEEEVFLDESEITVLNEKLIKLEADLPQHPEITVTWFQPDEKKSGGEYRTVTGSVRKIDRMEQYLILMSGERIPLNRIIKIK